MVETTFGFTDVSYTHTKFGRPEPHELWCASRPVWVGFSHPHNGTVIYRSTHASTDPPPVGRRRALPPGQLPTLLLLLMARSILPGVYHVKKDGLEAAQVFIAARDQLEVESVRTIRGYGPDPSKRTSHQEGLVCALESATPGDRHAGLFCGPIHLLGGCGYQ